MARLFRVAFDPRVETHLIADEGEIIVDEVRRHWMAIVPAILQLVLAAVIMVSALWVNVAYAWFPVLVGLVVAAVGGHRILREHMDRFVITNMRVFRVHGIFAQQTATMPMSRILDITVNKPFIGRIFNYGHFVFESAAQDQGLRLIRFVGRPDERDLTIQRVIQRSGLRTSMVPVEADDDD
ncbi:membrane protein YdbS with pleckstrin-like domain [Friedmanniella endophytica]|jgi:membrane protein YdbS with pleckstrin-like domain|uniref:Membrane protein YdbS with pleckstrin-like domain n=1 Tax=Microlunatus kandeliicorticis TaxID=1759536 RepID=A0A7W3IUT7_9ACTN|nr:PH domain-containing protein [Microlunatus kandeliicorticis]MBA8795520.1 membrane protein YdbS with pleckstrin-like domain [Microlunatus kandeliicorticis]